MDDVAVLRKELQNVQTAMMTDIHEIKSDTKLEEMRQENETLKSELSTLSLKCHSKRNTKFVIYPRNHIIKTIQIVN